MAEYQLVSADGQWRFFVPASGSAKWVTVTALVEEEDEGVYYSWVVPGSTASNFDPQMSADEIKAICEDDEFGMLLDVTPEWMSPTLPPVRTDWRCKNPGE